MLTGRKYLLDITIPCPLINLLDENVVKWNEKPDFNGKKTSRLPFIIDDMCKHTFPDYLNRLGNDALIADDDLVEISNCNCLFMKHFSTQPRLLFYYYYYIYFNLFIFIFIFFIFIFIFILQIP